MEATIICRTVLQRLSAPGRSICHRRRETSDLLPKSCTRRLSFLEVGFRSRRSITLGALLMLNSFQKGLHCSRAINVAYEMVGILPVLKVTSLALLSIIGKCPPESYNHHECI